MLITFVIGSRTRARSKTNFIKILVLDLILEWELSTPHGSKAAVWDVLIVNIKYGWGRIVNCWESVFLLMKMCYIYGLGMMLFSFYWCMGFSSRCCNVSLDWLRNSWKALLLVALRSDSLVHLSHFDIYYVYTRVYLECREGLGGYVYLLIIYMACV